MIELICSKKGVESFPFFLFLTLFLSCFVITIGFYQINSFVEMSEKSKVSEEINKLAGTMEHMLISMDEGSFLKEELIVPKGYHFVFYSENESIAVYGELNISKKLDFDLINFTNRYGVLADKISLKSGRYSLVLYYGNFNGEDESYGIFFKP